MDTIGQAQELQRIPFDGGDIAVYAQTVRGYSLYFWCILEEGGVILDSREKDFGADYRQLQGFWYDKLIDCAYEALAFVLSGGFARHQAVGSTCKAALG